MGTSENRAENRAENQVENQAEKQELKKVGLKVTDPRVKILKILEEAESHHLSAEAVYDALRSAGEDVGLATVYRVLTQFEDAGLVTRHNFEGNHAVFEINEGKHHDHMVCVKCRCVEEFLDKIIEDRQQKMTAKYGFKMTDHTLTIYGVCQKCV